ncbi:macro domain-containing protein [Variovorax dokdonensis]|uniref:Macro domain-containing protein n=1 Tax=Variovorax dokdonensis TaxID=344883 RepID=A0ABT7NGC4_9BURK|nr:macro domain-containing protein [Variovorax dokdonensis]MDM0046930.1 macro domain-containing protein [Variovorax dokdonensis]
MFKALIGDMFKSDAQTLVNTVNCVGVMGKGVALKFKEHFPAMFDDYVRRCARKEVKLGEPYVYEDLSGAKIVNFPTKDHWRSASRLVDIDRGLTYLARHYEQWGIKSLAMPPLGCGNGGLEWAEVGPLIYQKLHRLPLDIEVFAPYGTPSTELTTEFLGAPTQLSLEGKGRRLEKMQPGWVTLVEVLKELEDQPYAPPVGRTIFQKICYVVTELGVPTGFDFGKGSYGPFSADVKPALHDFANRNWIQEKPLGRMVALQVSDQFTKERSKFSTEIERYRKSIDKTVDLFSRIKDTEQAEEVLTVLFASRQVKKGDRNAEVDEQQIYDYILDWKKTWQQPTKQRAVAEAVRNLALLGWIRVKPSRSLMESVGA